MTVVALFVAGLVTPLVGAERFHGLRERWVSRGAGFIRASLASPLPPVLMLAALLLPASS